MALLLSRFVEHAGSVDKQSRYTETVQGDMRVRTAQRQTADTMAQFKPEQVTKAPIAADLRNTEDLQSETRKALGGEVDSLLFLVSPESRKRRRVRDPLL